MSDMRELNPDSIEAEWLDEVRRVLDHQPIQLKRRANQTPLLTGADGSHIELPADLHAVLVQIVDDLQGGNGVTVIPMHADLTTIEAAEILNVSRPFVLRMMRSGRLPHHMDGSMHRIKLTDVLAFRDHLDQEAAEAAQEIVDDHQEATQNA
jgi:excisionase family DNA binding protein